MVHSFVPKDDSPYASCKLCRGGRLNPIHDVWSAKSKEAVVRQLAVVRSHVQSGGDGELIDELLVELEHEISIVRFERAS